MRDHEDHGGPTDGALRGALAILAALIFGAAIVVAGCAAPPPAGSGTTASAPPPSQAATPLPTATPSATPANPVPLTPDMVEARLQTLDASLSLVPWYDDRDMGEYPNLVFRPAGPAVPAEGPRIAAVLVFPTVAARVAAQGDFRATAIEGPRGVLTWDGLVHSAWVGAENVIVEVVMPGGTFGGRHPTRTESRFPDRVALALAGS